MRTKVAAPWLDQPLLERDQELAALEAVLGAARGGAGGVAVIEGAAGIGKSRLLAATRAAAEGFIVLRARGGELERDFPWGVVRQLFEAEVALADPARRQALLAGAAATAAEPLGLLLSDVASPADASFAALHGLYWLAVNLAADGPVLLCVDDAQWTDAPSLRFLLYLGARAEELPLLILAAQRPVPPGAHDLAAQIPGVAVIRPGELSESAVGTLLGKALAPGEPAFVRACHSATGGNPFLITELLAQLRATGVAPVDDEAGRLEQLGPRAVARSVLRRLAPLPGGALGLARAVAVLGTDVELRHAAVLAGLTEAAAGEAADALAVAEVFRPGRPLEFVHPVVRAAVREDLLAGERIALHRRAARMLRAEGAAPGRVAVHLLATDPAGQPWVADALRLAAERAFARGAPDTAAEFLRRALTEPPPPDALPGLLRLLGRAALLAGDDAGAQHYRAAMEATTDAAERAAMGRELGVTYVPPGGYEEAVATLQRAVADAEAAGDTELARLIEADLMTAGRLHPATLPATRARADAIDPDTIEPTPAGRCLLGSLAFNGVIAGWPLARVAEVVHRAAHGELPTDAATTTNTLWDCGFVLAIVDDLTAADTWWQAILASARQQGSILTFARCSCFLAMTALRRGDLILAEAHARASLDAAQHRRWFLRRMATAMLVEALVERGTLDDARAALTAVDGDEELGDFMMVNFLLFARGRLRAAQGELAAGLDDFVEYGRRPGSPMRDNPAVRAWRSEAALAELALGRPREARRLAAEELELAEQLGSDRATGVALRALGLAEGGHRGEELLRRAVAVLARSPARLEHAHALVDLGAALRRSGRRADARGPLRDGMELAHRCAAHALVERAGVELRAAGARPRRPLQTGVEALTASERRVAEMAAGGMANREIAQALFVTPRTVEVHLTHAYGKLGISTRAELPAALAS